MLLCVLLLCVLLLCGVLIVWEFTQLLCSLWRVCTFTCCLRDDLIFQHFLVSLSFVLNVLRWSGVGG